MNGAGWGCSLTKLIELLDARCRQNVAPDPENTGGAICLSEFY